MDPHLLRWLNVPAIVVPAAAAVMPAHAVQYLSVEQAQRLMFAEGALFASQPVRLSATQAEAIVKYSRVGLGDSRLAVWRVTEGRRHSGWFVVDQVYGKHEFITYAVALDAGGAVKGVEILDYRETHGGEVRNPAWRAQFHGKRHGEALQLGKEIRNISGATLSCKHVTEGVRRILALHENALK